MEASLASSAISRSSCCRSASSSAMMRARNSSEVSRPAPETVSVEVGSEVCAEEVEEDEVAG